MINIKTHIGSQLPLSKYVIPIDPANTIQLNHYDISADDISGIRPLGAYIDESCVLYMDFNNIEGNILYDKSRCNNYGTIYGCTTANGRNGKALSFDGVANYVKITRNATLETTSQISIGVWFNTSDNQKVQSLISKTESGSYNINFNGDFSGYLSFVINVNYSYIISRFPSSDVINNTWNYIVGIYDGISVKLYLNGIEKANVPASGLIHHSNTNLYIGTESGPSGPAGSFFVGKISNAYIYNRALTVDEIYAQYNEGIWTINGNGKYGHNLNINKQTVNISLMDGQNGNSPWGGDGNPTLYGMDTNVTFRGKKVAKYKTGTSANCYINGTSDLSTSITSTEWTVSCYMKRVDGSPIVNLNGYLYITNNSNISSSAIVEAVEDGWYRVIFTRTGLTSGYPTLAGFWNMYIGTEYYFANWQVEASSFATSYISGAREPGKLIYKNLLKDSNEGTINFWAKYPEYNKIGLNGFTNTWISDGISQSIGINTSYQLQGFNNVSATIYEGNWHMYTLIKKGDVIESYIDAEYKGNYTDSNFMEGNYLSIGADINGTNVSNLMIDEFRIDKIARTEKEITAWMVCDSPFYPRGIQRVSL